MYSKSIFISILTSTLLSTQAYGQAEIVPEGEIKGSADSDVEGWNPALSLGGTVNIVSNTNAVGQVEGLSMLLGFGLKAGADYVQGPIVVRNELTVNESYARTPVVDKFLKTDDKVSISSTGNYFLSGTMGGFGQFKISTALFSARAITADPVDYKIREAKDSTKTRDVTSRKLRVASAFSPLTISQSLGGFMQPIKSKSLNLITRAGFGGRETFASGVLVQDDDDTTAAIELQELTNVYQGGLEFYTGVEGKAAKNRLSYTAGASLLLPFINNDSYERSSTDLLRVAVEASATVGVFDWMGLVFKGSVISDPQLFPQDKELTQWQANMLFTFQYTLIDRQKGIKELEEEAALEAAKRKEAAAEKKAVEAEEKALELQKELDAKKEAEKKSKIEETPIPAPTPAPAPAPTPAAPTPGV